MNCQGCGSPMNTLDFSDFTLDRFHKITLFLSCSEINKCIKCLLRMNWTALAESIACQSWHQLLTNGIGWNFAVKVSKTQLPQDYCIKWWQIYQIVTLWQPYNGVLANKSFLLIARSKLISFLTFTEWNTATAFIPYLNMTHSSGARLLPGHYLFIFFCSKALYQKFFHRSLHSQHHILFYFLFLFIYFAVWNNNADQQSKYFMVPDPSSFGLVAGERREGMNYLSMSAGEPSGRWSCLTANVK